MSYNIPPPEDSNMNDLMNKGWDSMAAILEKEMPQKKKKRVALFFWFGLIILGNLGFFYIFSTKNSISKDVKELKTPEKSKDIAENQIQIKTLNTDIQTIENIENHISTKNIKSATKGNFINNASENIKNESKIEPNILEDYSKNKNYVNQTIGNDNQKFEAISGLNDESNLSEIATKEIIRDKQNEILPIINSNIKPIENQFNTIIPSKYSPINIKKNNHFIAEIGINTSILSKKFGFQASVLYNFQMNRKLNLQTGLCYSYQFSPYQTLTNYNYDEIQPAINFAADINTTTYSIKKQQIRIPLGITYQLYKRWNITSGISMIYEKPIIFSSGGNNKNLISNETLPISYPKVNSFSMAVDAGILYKINRRFSVKTGILYNLIPISNKYLFEAQKSSHLESNLVLQYHF
jgi:hypothetical protein